MDAYEEIEWKETFSDEEIIADEDLGDSYVSRYINGTFSLETDVVPIETNFTERPKNPNQLPKIPGSQFPFKLGRKSRFNTEEHEALIKALKIVTSGRLNLNFYEKKDIEIYNNSKATILIENKEFLAFAEAEWRGNFGRKPLKIKASVQGYAAARRKYRLRRISRMHPFYKAVNLLPFSYGEDEIPIEMIHTANVLDVGAVAKFLPPTMREHFSLKIVSLPALEACPTVGSKMPVSEDGNVASILNTHSVDVVITFSALKRLINFTDASRKWDVPVVIREIPRHDSKGKKKMVTVVYIEKPLPTLQPTVLELNENCTKLMMKTTFCCLEAFTYESEDIPIPQTDSSAARAEEEASEREYCVVSAKKWVPLEKEIIRNRFYKLWSLRPKEVDGNGTLLKRNVGSREFGVLIRGKIDGCEANLDGTLKAVTVVPKMEFQLPFGGSTFSKRELANHWTHLYFKPYSNLYRARTHNFSGEVITIEPCSIDRVKNEAALHHNYKPQLGIGLLYKMFHELVKYPAGEYIIRKEGKNEAFLALYQAVNDEESCDFNLHKTYSSDAKIVEDYIKPWTPIDPTVLLPKYELDRHMPGLFKPQAVQKILYNQKWKRKWNGKSKKINATKNGNTQQFSSPNKQEL